ncbi:molybdopterin-dependent oxidoreductase [Nocardioides aurantiacus]|uniref:Molybdopterin-dependent oxidoreductase-like protein n=1 Tax=Nocardioides aurantiacus TaxID=86796 RepID=A0A3N2CNU6_9ACTN|nr:molybdopterin-dependent oxidoreductase [Nocardioides aurantiacus]ROR89199.1 molybdopterin-dependent oxidoreductase-like protein [Nocardioides aurantiacus]
MPPTPAPAGEPSDRPDLPDRPGLVLVAGVEVDARRGLLAELRAARRAGAHVVALDPLAASGSLRPRPPRWADELVQVAPGGDQALLALLSRSVVEAGAVDELSVARRTTGVEGFRRRLEALDPAALLRRSGVGREQVEGLARRYRGARLVHAHWGRGLTGQPDPVAAVEELTGLLLLRGHPAPAYAFPERPVDLDPPPAGRLVLRGLRSHHALRRASRHDVRGRLTPTGPGRRVLLVEGVDRETLGIAEEEVLDVVALDGSARVDDLQVVDTALSRGGVVALTDVVAELLGDGAGPAPGATALVRLERHPDAT